MRKTYRCGGWSSYDGPCGATDCSDCFHVSGPLEPLRDLSLRGYKFDDEDRVWVKMIHRGKHVCRRDHADGTVKSGQAYVKHIWRIVDDETGKQSHRRKVVVSP